MKNENILAHYMDRNEWKFNAISIVIPVSYILVFIRFFILIRIKFKIIKKVNNFDLNLKVQTIWMNDESIDI